MFGRFLEKMIRGTKATAEDGFLSDYLNALCPRYADYYQNAMKRNSEHRDVDALDVLAEMLMKEMNVEQGDLAAARAYLSILIENEHLPLACQLTASELNTLRELLFCYFGGVGDVNEKGAQVLSLIEHKFANGNFSQARILLQIFETNNETRQNNERNLYYEEMIVRLDHMSTRARSLSSSILNSDPADNSDDPTVLRALNACEQVGDVRFYLYLRDRDEMEKWQNALAPLPEAVQEYLLDYIPVIRWRKLGVLDEPLRSQFGRHMTYEMLRRHVQQKLKMCYFILLASGTTGHEWFIFAFSEWSKKHFNVDVREVFPVLHRSGIVDGMCLQDILDMVIERFYSPAMNKLVIRPETLQKAYHETLNTLFSKINFAQVPAGHYNFGDFLLDEILPFSYESPLFAFRLHCMM